MVLEFGGSSLPTSIVILLVSDHKSMAESLVQLVRDTPEIAVHDCDNPAEVISKAKKISPTVILLDLSNSYKDGLALIRLLRVEPITEDIPLVVFLPKKDTAFKAEAFAEGANDYLSDISDPVEFVARIRYHSAAYLRLLERNQAFERLDQSQKILKAELAEAATYVTSMLPLPLDGEIKTSWRFIPSTPLGGDAFGYHWVDEDNFAFYLLDVCGHGVGAALLSILVANVLRAQTLPNIDFLQPVQVLESLNENFPMEKHNNMFLTIWYGVFNKKTKMLNYASGGHPPAILIRKSEGKNSVKELSTYNLVIGAMPTTKVHSALYQLVEGDRLYLFSDGIYELQSPNGDHLQWEEFVDVLTQDVTDDVESIERVLEFSRSFTDKRVFDDDVSILEIIFR